MGKHLAAESAADTLGGVKDAIAPNAQMLARMKLFCLKITEKIMLFTKTIALAKSLPLGQVAKES